MLFGGKEKSTRKERERFGYFLGTLDFFLFSSVVFWFLSPWTDWIYISFIIRLP